MCFKMVKRLRKQGIRFWKRLIDWQDRRKELH
jgi:hypothetical protein